MTWRPAERPYQFNCDCDGLVSAIRRAARPGRVHIVDPGLGMDPTQQAVWWSKYVMRKARRLGLYMDIRDEEKRGAA